jgi:hypothetical protein
MKKLLTLLTAVMMVLSLTACGGDDTSSTKTSSKNNSSSSQDKGNSDSTPAGNDSDSGNDNAGGDETADLTTVNGFLSAFGLTENDLKCANFTRLDKTAHVITEGPEYGKITEIGAYVSQKLTDEEVKAWLEQIMGKLNSLSAEGKIDNLLSDEDLTTEYIMSEKPYMGSGSYTYNGKKVDVMITVMPGSLDSDDPDDAMAACTLGLEFD